MRLRPAAMRAAAGQPWAATQAARTPTRRSRHPQTAGRAHRSRSCSGATISSAVRRSSSRGSPPAWSTRWRPMRRSIIAPRFPPPATHRPGLRLGPLSRERSRRGGLSDGRGRLQGDDPFGGLGPLFRIPRAGVEPERRGVRRDHGASRVDGSRHDRRRRDPRHAGHRPGVAAALRGDRQQSAPRARALRRHRRRGHHRRMAGAPLCADRHLQRGHLQLARAKPARRVPPRERHPVHPVRRAIRRRGHVPRLDCGRGHHRPHQGGRVGDAEREVRHLGLGRARLGRHGRLRRNGRHHFGRAQRLRLSGGRPRHGHGLLHAKRGERVRADAVAKLGSAHGRPRLRRVDACVRSPSAGIRAPQRCSWLPRRQGVSSFSTATT